MDTLDKQLDTLKAPTPSDLLKARILREARTMRPAEKLAKPANDNGWKKWGAIAATALIMGFVGFSTFQTNNADAIEAQILADAADEMGYDTLYAWVHYDEDSEDISEDDTFNESRLKAPSLPI